jgi:cation diffusion facilitator CzcD-associated flavoprotein CzcO
MGFADKRIAVVGGGLGGMVCFIALTVSTDFRNHERLTF